MLVKSAEPLDLVPQARQVAKEMLKQLGDGGRRWQHSSAVAARVASIGWAFSPIEAESLQAGAWLHDIGYAPPLIRLGFHPIDGAIYVRDNLSWNTVARLVAHHSGARFIAEARGLSDLMRPFSDPDSWSGPVADALTWADQTTDPEGRRVTVEKRLEEMLLRRGPDSPNARCNALRAPVLIAAVRATEARLAEMTAG